MKRSRACDDLVALAAEASNETNRSSTGLFQYSENAWTPFVESPTLHRFKRSRPADSSFRNSNDIADEEGLLERHSLQFALEMNDVEGVDKEMTLDSSISSVQDDDSLPLRRNSRENMLLRKKKQRIAEITNSFSDFGIHDEDMSSTRTLHHTLPLLTRPQSVMTIDAPETPEPRILRGLCFAREARCIDPLDKRQAQQSFDMSALIMLSISKR